MKKWQLDSNWYEFLKWAGLIALPAIGEFYLQVSEIWNLPFGTEVSKTLFALGILIGVLIGISHKNFYGSMVDHEGGDIE